MHEPDPIRKHDSPNGATAIIHIEMSMTSDCSIPQPLCLNCDGTVCMSSVDPTLRYLIGQVWKSGSLESRLSQGGPHKHVVNPVTLTVDNMLMTVAVCDQKRGLVPQVQVQGVGIESVWL